MSKEMSRFPYRIVKSKLYVRFHAVELNYQSTFGNDIMYLAMLAGYEGITDIHIIYDNFINAGRFVKAALLGMLELLSAHSSQRFWVPKNFAKQVVNNVRRKSGNEFSKQNIEDIIKNDNLNYYVFKNEDKTMVSRAVDNISDLLVKNNIVVNEDEYKEFLSTVIGEVFLNSMMHSQQNEIVLAFDISFIDSKCYLDVIILDYGNTIIENVKRYHAAKSLPIPSNVDSVLWAMKNGNTTRANSGGYGLPSMRDYIKRMDGCLQIISGDVRYCLTDCGESYEQEVGYWQGTNVMFRVELLNRDSVFSYDKNKDLVRKIKLSDI